MSSIKNTPFKYGLLEKEESKEDYERKFARHIRNVYYNKVDLIKEVNPPSSTPKPLR